MQDLTLTDIFFIPLLLGGLAILCFAARIRLLHRCRVAADASLHPLRQKDLPLFVILLKAKLRPPFLPPAANLGSRSCRPCRRNSRRRAARSAKGPSRRAAQLAAADAMRRIMPYFKPPRRISAYRRTNPPAIPRLRTLSRAPFRSRVPPFSAARPLCAQGGLPVAHRARRTLPD